MKILIVMMAIQFIYHVAKAQTWSEWFRQNNTQLVYLQEQIAALQLYNDTQQTGYAVSETGLTEIDTTGDADYTQHDVHFEALRTPSEAVLHDPRIQDISNLCERTDLLANAIASLDILPALDPATWTALCAETSEDLDKASGELAARLLEIMFPGQTEMSDAEREQAIGELQKDARQLFKKAAYQFQLMTTQPTLP